MTPTGLDIDKLRVMQNIAQSLNEIVRTLCAQNELIKDQNIVLEGIKQEIEGINYAVGSRSRSNRE